MSKTKWGIGLLVGVLIGMVSYFILYSRYFSPLAQIGRDAHFANTATYVDVRTIEEKATKENVLTAQEVEALRSHLDDKEPRIQARVLTALGFAGREQAAKAIILVRSKLDDRLGVVRQYALGALDHLNAPDTVEVAQRFQTDPDPYVQAKAKKILAKRRAEKL